MPALGENEGGQILGVLPGAYLGPLGDFALPRLQDRFGALLGTVILGFLWGCWHLPLFLTTWGGPGKTWFDPVLFVACCIPLSLVMTWVFNRSGQSVPLIMLLHAGINSTYSLLWPEIYTNLNPTRDPMYAQLIATCAAALVILIATRGRLGLLAPDPAAPARTPAPL